MPEISDEDYKLLNLSRAALGNQKTRLKTLRAIKEASPDTMLPEIESEDRIEAATSSLREENKKLREDLDKRANEQLLKERRGIVKARGFDYLAVEKTMMEKGITSHESAMEFMEANSRVAAPAASPRSWDKSAKVPQEDGLKKDPAGWARETAAKVLDEFAAKK